MGNFKMKEGYNLKELADNYKKAFSCAIKEVLDENYSEDGCNTYIKLDSIRSFDEYFNKLYWYEYISNYSEDYSNKCIELDFKDSISTESLGLIEEITLESVLNMHNSIRNKIGCKSPKISPDVEFSLENFVMPQSYSLKVPKLLKDLYKAKKTYKYYNKVGVIVSLCDENKMKYDGKIYYRREFTLTNSTNVAKVYDKEHGVTLYNGKCVFDTRYQDIPDYLRGPKDSVTSDINCVYIVGYFTEDSVVKDKELLSGLKDKYILWKDCVNSVYNK